MVYSGICGEAAAGCVSDERSAARTAAPQLQQIVPVRLISGPERPLYSLRETQLAQFNFLGSKLSCDLCSVLSLSAFAPFSLVSLKNSAAHHPEGDEH